MEFLFLKNRSGAYGLHTSYGQTAQEEREEPRL